MPAHELGEEAPKIEDFHEPDISLVEAKGFETSADNNNFKDLDPQKWCPNGALKQN